MTAATPAINEALVRDVVEQVLGRLGVSPAKAPAAPAVVVRASGGGDLGVFDDPAAACAAARDGFEQLREKGVDARRKVVAILKRISVANADAWGPEELAETKIGRADHKVAKLQGMHLIPGVEDIKPEGFSGDHGIAMEELCPFGVIAAVTPATHSVPTVTSNAIAMVAAGNAVVYNTHPSGTNIAAKALRAYNEAIRREVGIDNLLCMVRKPTLESFDGICSNEHVRLVVVTGGPGVVAAAMKTGKRAICAGPGNPPVVVAEDACPDRAARCVIDGGGFDNNLLCIGEKEIFVVDSVADRFMAAMEKRGAVRLNARQVEALTQAAFEIEEGKGGGCARAHVNKDFVGRDAKVLAKAAGVDVADGTPLLFGETDENHPFVVEEQMMPFVPVVRVRTVRDGIRAAAKAEHGYRHTSIIHTHNVAYMTEMARALDTTLFIKNGACMAGLAIGGQGYPSYTIATPTGEGVTRPRTFTRIRRCSMVDDMRIY